ncbi:Cof-type HAD-IIB family hydrolase [Streptococcus loxodontisalivarius]|uniref:Cof subfamily protein (Haloacid dehalogenase superfamily) n=1 Tax=Streptococcus loxodontisalivarius TaxID=1349415 RepID=A0ABS2PUB1_9STRE|nr:HAD family hydrolase [Streptococcus loxodontisalivarius]MBM7643637.1 Cof subfamily protein (haloacid dehalogenase superfamily) [Streptococcus loxodontisalivarius]
MIRLVATDMDGTFLRKDGTYDRQRLEKLLTAFGDDIIFTVASGRALIAVDKLFEGFVDRLAIIAENGGVVQYKGDILFEQVMPKADYLAIVDLLESLGDCAGYLLSGRQGSYAPLDASQDYLDHMERYYENVQRCDLTEVEDDIFKVTCQFTVETVAAREEWLNSKLDGKTAVTTGFDAMDIIYSDLHKATGLKALAQQLEISPEEMIGFGDNLNDYEMLDFVGTAIATENARQEIKAISNQVIGHCDDEAVMTYLEGLVK